LGLIMTDISKERVENAARVHIQVCRVGAGIENREETVRAILEADAPYHEAQKEVLEDSLNHFKTAYELYRDAIYGAIGRDFGHLEPLEALKAWQERVLEQPDQMEAIAKLMDENKMLADALARAVERQGFSNEEFYDARALLKAIGRNV